MNEQHFNTVIKPKSGWFDLHLKEVFAYRDLIFLFVKRNFVSKYKQTVLGPAWAIIQPLLTTGCFHACVRKYCGVGTRRCAVVRILSVGNGTVDVFFKLPHTNGEIPLLQSAQQWERCIFPWLVMPISTVFSELISLAIQYVFLIIFLVYYAAAKQGVQPNLWMLMTPLIVLQLAMLSLGCGIIISALTTKYRDLAMLVGIRHAALDVRFPDCIRHVPFYRFCPRREVACAVYVQPNLADCKSVPLCISRNGRNRMEVLFHRLGDNSCPALHRHCAVSRVEKTFMDTV